MQSLNFTARGTVDSIITELDGLMVFDTVIERKLKKVTTPLWILVPLAIITLFLIPVITPVPFIICIAILVPLAIYRDSLKGQDLENRKLELGRALFNVIGQDISPGTECYVEIDMQGYIKHGQMLDRQKEGFFGGLTRSRYSDRWFSTRGKLCDGNVFKISIEQSVKRVEKTKRKYVKITESISESMKFLIKINRERYPDISKLSSLLQPSVSIGNLLIRKVQVTDNLVRIQAETGTSRRTKGRSGTSEQGAENLLTGKSVISLFLHFYRELQKCR
jgi:hypothetical protein